VSSPETTPQTAVPAVPDYVPADSIQTALAAEHAMVWALELATAFVSGKVTAAVAESLSAHRARRDGTERLLRGHGVRPSPAEPAYATPAPVVDQASAVAVLIAAETDLTGSWRAVIERTDDSGLRQLALDALTDSAVRAARWRTVAATEPVTVALPGQS
jgi:Domain of unknown function (DUF4439)